MKDDLRDKVKVLAGNLGFDFCHFTAADSPAHVREFRAWLHRGAAGEMHYLANNADRRCDPKRILPGAKSLIVTGLNYFQGENSQPSQTGRGGRIARYAWGEDYHEVMRKKLDDIDRFLRSHGGTQKVYSDTGPVLERDHAARAGAGWQGKSTMLLNREFGTWFFLGELLTTIEFESDPPQPNRCGRCTRCIDACPTHAITAPYQLDARRCISYLTIELKGSIPLEFRPLIGDRIYGCDDCLEACPWNRFARVSQETAFALPRQIASMALRDYLALDESSFRELFRKSPIKRTKRRGLLRNVCVALGNVGTADDLPALEKATRDPEPLVAEHARWAIEQIQSRSQIAESDASLPSIQVGKL